jgi:histidyl-tRNA synthetase
MSTQKPSIPKGTRDFTPGEMFRRNFIMNVIRNVFEKYGYMPLDTPAMENLSTLLGKYGEEGDKLLFRILNSGDFLKSANQDDLSYRNLPAIAQAITEKGLRYDLTVPFARFVVQHQHEITFPFKRYQIQPVWRADRPQKGRYREFIQCDVDVIGSNSLLNEAELAKIIQEVFANLGISMTIKLNNRKILSGIAEYAGAADRFMDITIAIDKLDKIGLEGVVAEMIDKGVSEEKVEKIIPFLKTGGTNKERLQKMARLLEASQTGKAGVEEMEELFQYLEIFGVGHSCEFDLSLARGLNYYTGTIFEVKAGDFEIGSICGGGRYDDLTGIFGLPDVSGVGVSFGADRIYDVMNGLGLFPEKAVKTSDILFVNFGPEEERYALPIADVLRKESIRAELYPDAARLKKQMKYADNKNISFVALAGENEIKTGTVTVREMKTGEQEVVKSEKLAEYLRSRLER